MVGSLSVRRVAHVRGGRVRGRLRRLALGALGSDGSQAVSAARSRRGGRSAEGVASFALLARAAAQHGSAAAAWAARSQGVSLEARGWVTFHGAKKIFMIFLRRAAFRSSAGCCSVLRIGILAEALREIRWRFDPAFLFRSWQRRLSRALCGIGGAEIRGSQGFSSRCRLLRDWKSLLDIMDIIYSICHILLLNSSSISILIRSIL